MKGLHIVATGRYAPEKIVTNDDLSQIVETSDEWIYTRTGMKKRHFCSEGEGNLFMATRAAKEALDKADIDPNEIGALVAMKRFPSPSLQKCLFFIPVLV